MNGYKKLFKSASLRHSIMSFLRFIPDKQMIKLQYRIKMGFFPNLNTPERYTEKLQWYKLNYRTDDMTICADKYRVREYLERKGLSDIACKLYGVYDRAEDINFDKLPERFVIKTTNGSGTNIICKNKSELDVEKTIQELNRWLKRPCYILGREWAYKNIVPKIIIEEYLEDEANPFEGINDYKFLCFSGNPEYVVFDCDRFVGHKRAIYTSEWKYVDVGTDCDKQPDNILKPDGFEQMKEIAKKLSEDFPCARVDLYWLNSRVYFGEITFYPWTGYIKFEPDEFDFELGRLFILPKKKYK